MTVSMYDTRTMLAAISLMPPLPRFLWDTFVGPNINFSLTETMEVDYRKGSVRMAPFVADDVGGIVVDRKGFNTALIKFPTIAPERLIRPADLQSRAFGENVYSGRTASEREQELLADDLSELRAMVALRREWMVGQLLLNTPGRLSLDVMTDNGLISGAMEVDYGFTNEIAVATAWDEANADPLADLESLTDAARDSGGTNPDIILMGSTAANAYRKNAAVREALDIRNLQAGSLTADYAGDYLKFIGISPNGLDMFSYSATYRADDGTDQAMLPPGRVAALSRNSLRAIFGPVLQLEPGDVHHTTYINLQEVPLYLPDYKKNTTGLRLTSRPMLTPVNVDGWAVADVL